MSKYQLERPPYDPGVCTTNDWDPYLWKISFLTMEQTNCVCLVLKENQNTLFTSIYRRIAMVPIHQSSASQVSMDAAPTFKPLSLSIGEIRASIPQELFVRSTTKSMLYLTQDILKALILFVSMLTLEKSFHDRYELLLPAWCLYWWFQGLTFTGLWVIGHECGHGAFSPSNAVNNLIGFVVHSMLWTPFFSWRIGHHRHHANHASMENDEVYVPKTRSDLGIPEQLPDGKHYSDYFEDTPLYTLFMLVRQQLLAFPAYLTFNISGQKRYPKWTNHYDPRSIIFHESQALVVIASDLGILAMSIFTYWCCRQFGVTSVIKYYGLPWLMVSHWFVMITYLHHTTPYIPHYRKGAWTFARGAAATVDRTFLGWQGRFFLHDVAHYHVIHHFFPKMPWYNGEEGTRYLKKVLGSQYMSSTEPVFKALWHSYNNCQFVEDKGSIVFYKNRKGESVLPDM